ncbi:MAG: polyprenyl synthetase family protein [Alphaproteobacteria bacterium]|nr:polyprenyl synthetase family protein [Alphaproteobacteria bacterium]
MYDFAADLKQFSEDFNRRLPDMFHFPKGVERRVVEAMFYSLSGGGKRLRPFLVCKTAALFSIDTSTAFRVAAALEMLHTYSLIHDDLPAMDNDDFRRGRPTCHKQFDEATAILAGDGLLTYAFEVLASADEVPCEVRLKLCALLARRAGAFDGMIAGQMLDLLAEESPNLVDDAIIRHIEEMKTGCLIAYACQAGAILGKASDAQYQAITRYARAIGIAFQITDDILDVTGDAALMGKTLGKDAAQDKKTFVSLYGLDNAKNQAAALIAQAKDCLRGFGDAAVPLSALADFILTRDH